MSFLYRAVPVARTAVRPSTRLFSTTLAQRKIVPDSVQEPLKKVDRAVSDKLVDGIDAAVNAKDKAAAAAGVETGAAKGKAEEIAGEARGKAEELKGQAKGKAEELKGQAKSKM